MPPSTKTQITDLSISNPDSTDITGTYLMCSKIQIPIQRLKLPINNLLSLHT